MQWRKCELRVTALSDAASGARDATWTMNGRRNTSVKCRALFAAHVLFGG
uniref:Uncharacterized protein n=1 Tax=Hyaloperonospora arabidopsidis (strain Emoy2) TaxID=559515 RepID=M4BEM3_HYAAE